MQQQSDVANPDNLSTGFRPCARIVLGSLIVLLAGLSGLSRIIIVEAAQPPGILRGDPEHVLDHARSPHGVFQFLEQDLYRSAELSRLLDAAQTAAAAGQADVMMELLSRLLSEPWDVFLPDPSTETISSLHAATLQLLRNASPDIRRRWELLTESPASAALQAAVQAGDRRKLHSISRQYPFTRPGIDASILMIIDRWHRGDVASARTDVAALLALYANEPRFQDRIRKLNLLLQNARLPVNHADAPWLNASWRPATDLKSASAPWPKPLWTWEEAVQSMQGVQVPDWPGDMASASPTLSFSNWLPLIRRDMVIFRSPFRLLGFDKLSGKQIWEVATETRSEDDAWREDAARAESAFRLPGVHDSWVTSRSSFGLLAGDDQYIYFVDRFQSPSESHGPGMPGFPGRNRGGFLQPVEPDFEAEDEARVGERLVALRLSPETRQPAFAWSVGAPVAVPYQIRGGDAAAAKHVLSAASAPESGNAPVDVAPGATAIENPFTDHQFLCVPEGAGSRLFVLTTTPDQLVWMNCLQRSSGELLWRQPILFDPSLSLQRFSDSEDSRKANVSFVVNDLVICSLSCGVVTGLRQSDGQLQWATCIREADTRFSQLAVNERLSHGDPGVAFLPVVSETTMVCASSQSSRVFALDLTDGRILWHASRLPDGPGATTLHEDSYAAGISDGRVILIGGRHCRALRLDSGMQDWVVEIAPTTGRAFCMKGRCLIPESDGRVATVTLNDGILHHVSRSFLPEGFEPATGAITGDDEVVVVSTPISASVFFRSSALLERLDSIAALQGKPLEKQLVRAQAALLQGDRVGALETLRQAIATAGPAADTQALHRFSAEFMLQESGGRFFASAIREHSADRSDMRNDQPLQNQRTSLDALAAVETAADLLRLRSLQLDENQQLRMQLFHWLTQRSDATLGNQLRIQLDETGLDELITIDGDWITQPRLLLSEEWPESRRFEPPVSPDATPLRPRQIEAAVLFPESLGNAASLLTQAEALLWQDNPSAAESLVLVSRRELDRLATDPLRQHNELLARIRGNPGTASEVRPASLVAPTTIPEPADAPRQSENSAATTSETADDNGLQVRTLHVTQEIVLRTPDSLSMEISRWRLTDDMPSHSPLLWLNDDNFGNPPTHALSGFDLSDGTCVDQVTVPFSPVETGPVSESSLSTGLALLAGPRDVAVVSVVQPGSARLLWHERVREDPVAGVSGVIPGPIGPDYAVWQSARRLHCSHPLTGRLLWSRDCSQTRNRHSLLRENPLFGDDRVTVVLSSDRRSYQRFRTRDGLLLGSGSLDIGYGNAAVSLGRKLAWVDSGARLHLLDPLTDEDVLRHEAPVELMSVDAPLRPISEGRLLAVTRSQEIVLIDTRQNRVVFRSPVAGQLNTRFIFGMSVFERSGLLLVGLNDEQAFGQNLRAVPRLGEPRLDFGRLFCLDPATGRQIWTTRTDPMVVPPVAGDPCDLLVTWAELQHDTEHPRKPADKTLRLKVYDLYTGQLLVEREDLSWVIPFRCVHHAEEGTTRLHSQGSVISISERRSELAKPFTAIRR